MEESRDNIINSTTLNVSEEKTIQDLTDVLEFEQKLKNIFPEGCDIEPLFITIKWYQKGQNSVRENIEDKIIDILTYQCDIRDETILIQYQRDILLLIDQVFEGV